MKDGFEVHYVKYGKPKGWRFRLWKAGENILASNGTYPTAEDAARVAKAFNRMAYCGAYHVRTVKAD